MRPSRGNQLLALVTIAASMGCSSTAEPRSQLIVVVDTDAPIVGQAQAEPRLSLDAAIDTLRIDVLEGADEDPLDLVAPDVSNWPISFGIAAPHAGTIRLRIRAFRGKNAELGSVDEQTTLEPPRWATIDRLVELTLDPDSAVQKVRVTLRLGCMAQASDFVDDLTCIDENTRSAPPSQGIERLNDTPVTIAGSSPLARQAPCSGSAPDGSVCIPGGFTLLGDLLAIGLPSDGFVDPVPPRSAVLSPFFMDVNEMTVARFRSVAGRISAPAPNTGGACTYSAAAGTGEQLPLNCVSQETAAEACAAFGGSLPSEAQWEHAARGRGQGRRYVWGDEPPSCCAASIAKPPGCQPPGIEPVGSHANPESCNGVADISRDQVLDLAGSLSEHTLDAARPYDDPCWGDAGPQVDPRCPIRQGDRHVTRGSNWGSGMLVTQAAARPFAYAPEGVGFRCVYPGGP